MSFILIAGVVLFLVLVKKYFVGGTCKVRRDLNGRVAVVTGGNTGIGKQTIRELLRNNCKVIMGARDRKKSEEAVKQLITSTGNRNIEFITLDLGSLISIREFASAIQGRTQKIDYLINNAGVMAIPKRTSTSDGFEMQFGINHIGHFYLTYLLWDTLKKSDDLRIVNLSSLAHTFAAGTMPGTKVELKFDDLNSQNSYHNSLEYSRSKLANVLFTKELSRRYPRALSVALHPGVVRTQLTRYSVKGIAAVFFVLITPIFWLFTKSPMEGAQTTLYTVFEDRSKLTNGGYFSDCKEKQSSAASLNEKSQQQLWSESERLLDIKFLI